VKDFMAKMTSRAKQAEATKNKIYECGVKLIRKYGFDQVTVEQISSEAGVSVGTYYYYFESKFELFSEIYKRADEYFQTHVEGKLEAQNSVNQIIEFFDRYSEFNSGNGIEMVKKLYTADNKMFINKGRAMQNILQAIVEEGQGKGEITSSLSAEEIANILFVTARGIVYDWCLHDGNIDLKEDMKKTITLITRGLA
jgi:AcrR family transcriptional regulator